MRQWLVIWVSHFLRGLLGGKSEPSTGDTEEGEPGDEPEKCPICGDDWDKGEIFCYHCGYEFRDEAVPLHPPPERTGTLTDPDAVLGESEAERIREMFAAISQAKGWDIAILMLPESLAQKIRGEDLQSHNYDIQGVTYCLYNTWGIGKHSQLKGMLIVIDPNSPTRLLVQGKNGPGVSGSVFRNWFKEYVLPQDIRDRASCITAELDYLASKIEGLQ